MSRMTNTWCVFVVGYSLALASAGCDVPVTAKTTSKRAAGATAAINGANTITPDQSANQTGGVGPIELYFSPKGGCTEAAVAAISQARQTIKVQAYSFTSAPIAKALTDAFHRGVKVIIVLDKSQRTEGYSEADFVAHAGIPCYIDAQHAIAHNKIMLIDGHTIITGSFNFTKAAESSNAENMLVLHDHPQLYAAYEANFAHHLEHSEAYAGK